VHAEVDLGQAVRAGLPAGSDLAGWSIRAAGAYGEIRAPRDAAGARAIAALAASLATVDDAGTPVFARILTRARARKLGYDPRRGPDLLVWTRPGYRLSAATRDVALVARRAGPFAASGWLADEPASRGLWLAVGAGVEKRTLREPFPALAASRRFASAAGFRMR
jgi:hypothetical protein